MISGIICEYNPMHRGHVYHINETRKFSSAVVCAMSGNYVQRGEPAFVDKWARAKTALKNGADIVVEIPVYACLDSAKNYARAGIELLNSLGCECVSCGAENNNSDVLEKVYDTSCSEAFSGILRKKLKEGIGYPSAFAYTIERLLGREYSDFISSPNNTLALEYFSAIKEQGSKMNLHLIKRAGSGYNDMELSGEFSSATAIRNAENIDLAEESLADEMLDEIHELVNEKKAPAKLTYGEKAIMAKLLMMSKNDIFNCVGDIDLANRLYRSVRLSACYDDLIEKTKTRVFTEARVKRSILRSFLDIDAEFSYNRVPFVRVLAMNKTGASLLHNVKIPVVTSFSDTVSLNEYAKKIYELQSRSTALYGAFTPQFLYQGAEEKTKLVTM